MPRDLLAGECYCEGMMKMDWYSPLQTLQVLKFLVLYHSRVMAMNCV